MSLDHAGTDGGTAAAGADRVRRMPSRPALPITSPSTPGRLWAPDRPSVVVVTDRTQLPAGRTLEEVVGAALEGGADGVLVRERDLPAQERTALLAALSRLCLASGAALLVATPLPDDVPVSGIHLRRGDPVPGRQDAGPSAASTTASTAASTAGLLVGRSCHDLAELIRAGQDRLDHVTLSPVAPSGSKPGYGPPLGHEDFGELLRALRARFPRPPRVLALGGVDAANAGRWVEAGADGVAVMGAAMRSPDPAEAVRQVVEAVGTAAAHASPAGGPR